MESSDEHKDDDGPAQSNAVKPVVCFLGPISSYTHQATLETFPADKFDLMPVTTIKDIFDTTQSGAATYGVVPFENSTNGSVVFTLDHFADRDGVYPDVTVCAEIYLDVHHCIVGHIPHSPSSHSRSQPPASSSSLHPPSSCSSSLPSPLPPNPDPDPDPDASPTISGQCTPTAQEPHPAAPRSRPLHPLTHVRRLYSHPQAFGQCTRFLAAYLKGVETVDVSSTSRAAELVRDEIIAEAEGLGLGRGGSPTTDTTVATSAAISSAVAADLLGLDVLARDVEDREDNTTRFFVLRRGVAAGPDDEIARLRRRGGNVSTDDHDDNKKGNDNDNDDEEAKRRKPTPPRPHPTKSLVSFTVPHRSPGALADVLECFRRGGLNLTSISSRPSLEAPFRYVFFVEFEGHRLDDRDGRVDAVLRGVAAAARAWRWLGSWENMRP
ncbi:Prephenate dehydratase-domain-containing protein [Xylariaceae sp. FL0662B]|nr:Prephenate dehydratase-domain-containing protein [Xylariaceae sp. FL0662B]